jgi:topoisomerase-4 subunit A
VVKLTEIKIKRISKFDAFKADEHIKELNEEIKKVKEQLGDLKNYTIAYFKNLLRKYSKGKERKTKISEFETIIASKVVMNNAKLYVNRAEGFIGYGLKKDEFVTDCSDIDDIIAFTADGKFKVVKIDEKVFVGKNIIHVAVFSKDNENTIYNMLYQDGPRGAVMVKRFNIGGVTRDKEYDLTKGTAESKVLYFNIGSPVSAPVVTVKLKPKPKLRNLESTVEFGELLIKGRSSIGNVVTKFPIAKVIEESSGHEQVLILKTPAPVKTQTKLEL